MKLQSSALIDDLCRRTEEVIRSVKELATLDPALLKRKPDSKSWSVLECLEHLNLYGDFYLPEIEQRILKAPVSDSPGTFRSGILGNYFALSMLPSKDGSVLKMKTFKDKNPLYAELEITTIDRFFKQQEKVLDLLYHARRVDLVRVKTAISISSLFKLRLGDTFRVIVYHNQRHILQAQKVLKTLSVQI